MLTHVKKKKQSILFKMILIYNYISKLNVTWLDFFSPYFSPNTVLASWVRSVWYQDTKKIPSSTLLTDAGVFSACNVTYQVLIESCDRDALTKLPPYIYGERKRPPPGPALMVFSALLFQLIFDIFFQPQCKAVHWLYEPPGGVSTSRGQLMEIEGVQWKLRWAWRFSVNTAQSFQGQLVVLSLISLRSGFLFSFLPLHKSWFPWTRARVLFLSSFRTGRNGPHGQTACVWEFSSTALQHLGGNMFFHLSQFIRF